MKPIFRMLLLIAGLALSAPGSAQDGAANINIDRWLKGTIEYRKISTGAVSGSEEWRITVHPDGSRTLNTTNRLESSGTQRTVVLRVARNFRPLDLYALFWYQGAWVGTGLMTVDGNVLNAVVSTPHGRVTQQVAVPERFAFIPHPLQSNVWQIWAYDKAKGGPQSTTVYDLKTRVQGPGNVLGPMYDITTTLVGSEDMTTPAGKFRVDRFRNSSGTEIYVTGPDAVMVRFVWPEADEEYVLTSLAIGR
jgi:hypothetical protein